MSEASPEPQLPAVKTAVSDLQRPLDTLSPSPGCLDQIIGSLKEEPLLLR